MKVNLITRGDPGKLTGGYLFHQRLAAAARDNGSDLRFISVAEGPLPLSAWSARGALRPLGDADVVVIDSIAAAETGLWLGRGTRPPVIAMIHQPPGGMEGGPAAKVLRARLDMRAYRRLDRLVAASTALARELLRRGLPPSSIEVVAPGCDPLPTAEAHPDMRRGRACAVLTIGNWLPRKGILDVIEAVAQLPRGLVTLHLAGDDSAEASYARRVRRRLSAPDVSDRVVVHGRVSPAEISALYRGADVFALPSYAEPYGTVYGEALAAGLPIVGYAAGNLPHLTTHGSEAFHAAPGAVEELRDKLRSLAEDPLLRRRMAAQARRTGRLLPTWEETCRRFFEVLRSVAEGHSRRV
ncbi:MAG TPA: glycosyltransferase family 4 protein [Actinomycetota bacterium]|jgi:glycosyltransferase involved in cell wall biosynthesis|nr:glycosyltransferase family 4 protein [Actinomycetota bacterium]